MLDIIGICPISKMSQENFEGLSRKERTSVFSVTKFCDVSPRD